MDLWAGRSLVCLYWISPNIMPVAQITNPQYRIERPATVPPAILKITLERSGNFMSAYPAKAAEPEKVRPNAAINDKRRFLTIYVTSIDKYYITISFIVLP